MIIGLTVSDFNEIKKTASQPKNFWKDRNNSLESLIPVEVPEETVIEKKVEIKKWITEHISYDIYVAKINRYEKIGVIERDVPITEEQVVVTKRSFGPIKLPPKKKIEEVVIGSKKVLMDDNRHNGYWIFHFKDKEEATLFKLAWV